MRWDLPGVADQQHPAAGFPAQPEHPGPGARREPVGPQHHQVIDLVGHHPRGHGPPGRRPRELLSVQPVHCPAQRAQQIVGEGLRAGGAGRGMHDHPAAGRVVAFQQADAHVHVVPGVQQDPDLSRHCRRAG